MSFLPEIYLSIYLPSETAAAACGCSRAADPRPRGLCESSAAESTLARPAAGMATTGAIKLDIGPDADEGKDELLSTRMASNRAVSEAHHGHRMPNRPPAH